MASDPNRFQAPSDRLEVGRLLAETYRVTAWGLLLGIGVLAGVFVCFMVLSKERAPPPPALTTAATSRNGTEPSIRSLAERRISICIACANSIAIQSKVWGSRVNF